TPTPTPTFNISGQITDGQGSAPLAGVTVTLNGTQSATTQTNASGNYSFTGVQGGGSYTVFPSKPGFSFNPPSQSFSNLNSNAFADFIGTAAATPTPTPTPTPTVPAQFTSNAYVVNEGAGTLTVTVQLSAPAPAPGAVDYATAPDAATVACNVANGAASERCDYTTTLGTLRFSAGEQTKSFQIFITDDAYVEGNETFNVTLSNPTGGIGLGTPASAVVTVADNDSSPGEPNPVDSPQFFVQQHYIDFLSRQGDAAGVSMWVGLLTNCNGSPSCDRISVSSAFFRSDEFQLKGYFVVRFYTTSLGENPDYRSYMRDTERVTGQTAAEVLANRDAFTNEWVERPDFRSIYDGLSNQAYVDRLEQTAGVVLSNKAQLVANLDAGAETRAQVLRNVVESDEVKTRMYNDAFVLMQYFGYLRRTPEAAGYADWLNYLDAHPGDFRTMVFGFVNSTEYRMRFGAPSGH
ncbi:MAG: carboxypeptidase regulatory-like domain-containing protein, partial [Acidobacteria bacterium]|nr:carboxypeptidase regulatory-like domain-containing protein [Acidobacteriota bacterium]